MDIFQDIWKKTKIQYKYAFLGTILIGILSQGMGLFNKYSLHDDVQYFFHQDNVIRWGRWALHVMIKAERHIFGDGNFSLPVFNGAITIFCIALSVCLLVDLLDIKSTVLCLLIAGTAVSFPGVTSLMGHMYTAHFYSLALFFSVLGPYLILKKNKWYFFVAGIGFMVLSAGIYQAYIPVILSVFLIGLIKLFADSKNAEQRTFIFKKAGLILFCGIVFIALYFLVTNLFLRIYHETLIEYKDIDTMGKLPLNIYFERMLLAYREFLHPSAVNMYDVFPGTTRFLNYGIMVLSLVLYGILLYSHRTEPVCLVILFLLFLLIPLAVNFIFVMADASYCNSLMVYGKVMYFVFFAWLLEKTVVKLHHPASSCAKAVCPGILGLLVLFYCRFDNVMYLQMEMLQTATTRYFSTLVTRIQSVEGYDSWKYVAFLGIPQPGRNDNSVENVPEMDHIVLPPVHYGLQNSLKVDWKNYLKYWCGYTAHEVDPFLFIDRPEVQDMPHYPAEGSIKVIDDTVVVKF